MLNSLFLSAALMLTPQTHTPSAAVSGDVVTIDADIAWITTPSAIDPEVLEGTTAGQFFSASYDGVSPIQWRLPPGDYQITAYGFPDDRLNPQRTVAVLDVTIQAPDRLDQIASALRRLTIALFDAGQARDELDTLNPTRQELIDVLMP